MNAYAYAEYPINIIINRCNYNIKIINKQIILANSVKIEDNEDVNSISAYLLKLNSKLSALTSLLNMCNTRKKCGGSTHNYITLDLEFVELLWPNI